MNALRKSDRLVVPAKSANRSAALTADAESMEERGLANRIVESSSPYRTQSRVRRSHGWLGYAKAAEREWMVCIQT